MHRPLLSASVRESRLRRRLSRLGELGYLLRKDRARSITLDHQGGYQIVDPYRNWVVLGSRYELDIDDVEAWLAE